MGKLKIEEENGDRRGKQKKMEGEDKKRNMQKERIRGGQKKEVVFSAIQTDTMRIVKAKKLGNRPE